VNHHWILIYCKHDKAGNVMHNIILHWTVSIRSASNWNVFTIYKLLNDWICWSCRSSEYFIFPHYKLLSTMWRHVQHLTMYICLILKKIFLWISMIWFSFDFLWYDFPLIFYLYYKDMTKRTELTHTMYYTVFIRTVGNLSGATIFK
jgi:hypothetical protein